MGGCLSGHQVLGWDPEAEVTFWSCTDPPKNLNCSLWLDTEVRFPINKMGRKFQAHFPEYRGGEAGYREGSVSGVGAIMPPTVFRDNGPLLSSLVASGNESWNFS